MAKYTNITLYDRPASVQSKKLIAYLEENNIRWARMNYVSDYSECLNAIKTWFPEDDITSFPILVWDHVTYESPDKTIVVSNGRSFTKTKNDLPSDFSTLAEKKS